MGQGAGLFANGLIEHGVQSVSIAGAAGNQDLTIAQYQSTYLTLTGAITGARVVRIPTTAPLQSGWQWCVFNQTTGAFAVSFVSAAGGAAVVIPQGTIAFIHFDGVNMVIDTPFNFSGGISALNSARLAKSVAGGADVTLLATEYHYGIIELTGLLTASINVILPLSPGGEWIIFNNTTGAFQVTVKTPAGTGVIVRQGFKQYVYCDAANIVSGITDLSSVRATFTRLNLSVAGGANVTLTDAQAANRHLEFSGVLTASIIITFPVTDGGEWVIWNTTTGAFTITVKVAGGATSTVIAQTKTAIMRGNAADMIRASLDA